ncbi:CHAP domain-containing protein [Nucisporomicrobium flavum]|uniref:CHAP domain-containing protein n=1 Tax=Nucisporomicrobium flavum TaxID=2785915 RepID=UPI0018F73B14|nr:CHAP domain-containing protein [Nucisporomicrobium flavum]
MFTTHGTDQPGPGVDTGPARTDNRIREADGPQDVSQEPGPAADGENRARHGGADRLLDVARSQLGYREGARNDTKYGRWYGMNHAAWCDMFVSWCADRSGLIDVVGRFAYTVHHAGWFRQHGRWGRTPRPGAIVFFDWRGGNDISGIDHVGIVEAVRGDGAIVTIEGNTGDMVARRVRRANIVGYGYPDYGDSGDADGAPPWPGRELRRTDPMMHGGDVRMWQTRMRQRGWPITADGWYGDQSARACRRFQREKGLDADGVVGPRTWRATWEAQIS